MQLYEYPLRVKKIKITKLLLENAHEVDALDREAIHEHWDQLWHVKRSDPNQLPKTISLHPIIFPYSHFLSSQLPTKRNIHLIN
jgi:hypothetical protein